MAKKEQYWDSEQDAMVTGIPLGFLNAYEPQKKTFEKKKQTQIDWAYGCHILRPSFDDSGNVVLNGKRWEYIEPRPAEGPFTQQVEYINLPVEIQPVIWDNEPMEGFRVLKYVSRYSTSNKLWRILDPRGMQFEISTDTFCDLVQTGVVDKGLIVGKCVWLSNKNLVRVD